MVTKSPSSVANDADITAEKGSTVKKRSMRVPTKEHKAKREKMKRSHMNELFLELGHAIEPSQQNNGKACILNTTTRLLRDLTVQLEALKKENAVLLAESRYVTVETDELRDENSVLEAEIERLQDELREKTHSSDSDQPTSRSTQMQDQPIGPLYVIPIQQEPHPFTDAENTSAPPNPPSIVSRPHPRYPSPSDSWPLELLSKHQTAAHEGSNPSKP
ncbi:Transcription factor bHLH47 [Ananas comosus]|uniref:Transcription factor bHLH47 n=1 Tax=Ananas comosus TaxID=4615 RepID=A0A199VQA9_ANACO|nr:Transcription factor bHLH47 [Ananas comosus]